MFPGQATAVIERLRKAGRVQRIPALTDAVDVHTPGSEFGRTLEVIGPVDVVAHTAIAPSSQCGSTTLRRTVTSREQRSEFLRASY